MQTLFLFIFLCGLIYYYLKQKLNYWKLRNVAHSKPNLLFGNIFKLLFGSYSPSKFFGDLYKKFDGPYFGFFAFYQPWLVIKDPEIVRQMIISDHLVFMNRILISDEKLDPLISNSLIGIKTPQWKVLRTLLAPAFTTKRLKEMMHAMKQSADNLANYFKNQTGKSIEVQQATDKYTTDVITRCFFGVCHNSFLQEEAEIKKVRLCMHRGSFKKTVAALSYFFAHLFVKIFRLPFVDPESVSILKRVCSNSIKQREASKIKQNDFIDDLLDLKNSKTKQNGFKNDEDNLSAHSVTFFVAGFEATSTTVAFTLHELSINCAIQERLRKEILDVMDHDQEISYDTIKNMKYLHMIISETLRKYPLIPFVSRRCAIDYKIPQTGLTVEKGTPILIPKHGLHWDEKYFPNPEVFNPERFSDKNKKAIVECAYQPFGNGPRNCIGDRFALLTTKVALIEIIRNFQVERNAETREPLEFGRSGILRAVPGVFITFKELLPH